MIRNGIRPGRPALSVLSATLFVLVAASLQAAPIFQYSLPASWNGMQTTVDDLSSAGNDANLAGNPALSSMIPPGADPATQSLDSHAGGFQTQATALLNNADVAAAGGFRYDVSFLWDGTAGSFPVQKVIDYAGTESLQLAEINTTLGTANLRFQFDDDPLNGVFLPIFANTWYDVSAIFNTLGNPIAGDGSITGLASLTLSGVGGAVGILGPATKTNFGDSLNRRIGVGIFSVGGGIIELEGFIHDPSVSLIPEPSTAALLWILASLPVVGTRRRH